MSKSKSKSNSKLEIESTCPDICEPVKRQKYYRNWLVTGQPPNSYTIEIAYINTTNSVTPGTLSSNDSYTENELSWMTMPPRFTNFAQAKIYGTKFYPNILFRVGTSNEKPNYFKLSQ